MVSSVNIWNNRSLFFEEYIYNTSNLRSSISNYSSEVRSFLEGDMTEQENLQFTIYNPNTYYYLTLKETGEVFSNLPATLDYETVLSQENMLVYQYIDNKYESKIAEYAIQITGGDKIGRAHV